MKKNILITAVLCCLFTLNGEAANMSENTTKLLAEAKSKIKAISPNELRKLIDNDAEFIQLDVRENNQYGHGEIWSDNSVKLTRGYIEYKVEHAIPNKKAKIVVVCCSGKRAILTGMTLKRLGYTDVEYLEGGVGGWLKSGNPLDTVFGELYLKED